MRFPAHSSKVEGKAADSRSASAGGQPFSRMQRTSTSRVELTNETDRHCWPARRCSIHCRLSAASVHRPEIANCRSLMPRPRGGGERAANGVVKSVVNSVPVWGFCFRFVPFLPSTAFEPKRRKPRFHGHFLHASAPAGFAQRMRVERMAGRDALVEGVGVPYLKFAPPDRPNG